MRSVVTGLSAIAAMLLAGCATTGGQRLAEKDPLEPFNRGVWAFNLNLDRFALKPAAKAYNAVTPTAARRGVHNVFDNAAEPLSFINALLQGKVGRAFHTLGRFVVNTTIGVGGLADHATDMGLQEKPEDFGQTLAVWGVNAGPYLMLPLLGPSTLRDGVGRGVEFVGDPFRIVVRNYSGLSSTERLGITGLQVIDLRAQLMAMGADNVLETSLDSYATTRAAYLQHRQALILDQDEGASSGNGGVNPADFDMDDGAGSAPSPGVDPKDFEIAPDANGQQPSPPPPTDPSAPSTENQPKIDGPE